MADHERVAVVTGANKGIGFAACGLLAGKGLRTVLTGRDEKKVKRAADSLKEQGLRLIHHQLDVSDPESIKEFENWIYKEIGRADVLVNNAGVYLDKGGFGGNAAGLDTDLDTLRQTMETNLYGPLRMCQALVPLMKKNRYGRIVNVSSGMGQLADMNGGSPAYRISKAALNALTRIIASETSGDNILVNSAAPGWVATDMGGRNAPRSPEEGADTIVWLATMEDGGPTGGFFKDRRQIPW